MIVNLWRLNPCNKYVRAQYYSILRQKFIVKSNLADFYLMIKIKNKNI